MGLDLIYNADDRVFEHRFSMPDWATLSVLREQLPDEVDLCFNVPEFGEQVPIATADLKRSAASIERFLAENSHLLPATYQWKLERSPVPGAAIGTRFTSGALSGIRLPDDPDHFYSIDAGLNELTLTKWAIGSDGLGVIVKKRDLRGSSELITANCGKMTFRRRAKKTELRQGLRKIIDFAEQVSATEVTKILC